MVASLQQGADELEADHQPCPSLDLSLGGHLESPISNSIAISNHQQQQQHILNSCIATLFPPPLKRSKESLQLEQTKHRKRAKAGCNSIQPLSACSNYSDCCLDSSVEAVSTTEGTHPLPVQKAFSSTPSCLTQEPNVIRGGTHHENQAMNQLVFEASSWGHLHESPSASSCYYSQTTSCPSSYSQESFNSVLSATMPSPTKHDINAVQTVTPPSSMKQIANLHADKDGTTSCYSTLCNEDLDIGGHHSLLRKPTTKKPSRLATSLHGAIWTTKSLKNIADNPDHEQSSSYKSHNNEFEAPRSQCSSNSDILGSMDSSLGQHMPSMQMHGNLQVIPSAMAGSSSCLWGFSDAAKQSSPVPKWGSFLSAPINAASIPAAGGCSSACATSSGIWHAEEEIPASPLVRKVVDDAGNIGKRPHGNMKDATYPKPVKAVRFFGVDKDESAKPAASSSSCSKENGAGLLKRNKVGGVSIYLPASVSTTSVGPKGKTIRGMMYISEKLKQAQLVCSCHGTNMTPAEFVQHSGSTDLSNPERRIVVDYFPCAGGRPRPS